MAGVSNPFVEFQALYKDDWVRLVREVLEFEPDEDQTAILRAINKGERRISIRSGHGTGKTTTLALATVCHALTRFPQVTVCTAPTSSQLFDALAAQTKSWFKKLPQPLLDCFELKSESIHHKAAPDDSFISFRTSRPEMPEALAGVHSENVLLIADEASGDRRCEPLSTRGATRRVRGRRARLPRDGARGGGVGAQVAVPSPI